MGISSVTSEALQLKLRQLLPSQQGFGTDLSASDTILPIIDLTRAAEGSDTPEYLQTALAHGSSTAFDVINTATTIINQTGFFRVLGVCTIDNNSGSPVDCNFEINDGSTTVKVWRAESSTSTSTLSTIGYTYDFIVFLRAGDSLVADSNAASANLTGSTRQVADVNGTLVNPSGFTPQ